MKINAKEALKATIFIVAFFVSCQSEYSPEELVDLAEETESFSVETATDVDIAYTDSGRLRANIHTNTMKRYPTVEDPYLEMTDGVRAQFYSAEGEVQSTLTANYAINYEKKDIIVIRDSVRVINKNDEEIKTQELNWDKNERRIYSDKNVRIRVRDEKILVGEGFESNETFTKYTIKKLTGTIRIKPEEKNEEERK